MWERKESLISGLINKLDVSDVFWERKCWLSMKKMEEDYCCVGGHGYCFIYIYIYNKLEHIEMLMGRDSYRVFEIVRKWNKCDYKTEIGFKV